MTAEIQGKDMKFDWHDTEDIALLLAEKYPNLDPLTVRFTDLFQWIIDLPEFEGDPEKSSEGILEQIQMAWHEEFSGI